MKRVFLSAVALTVLAAPAFAADMPARTYTKAPVYAPAPIYNWTGFYIFGGGGGRMGSLARGRVRIRVRREALVGLDLAQGSFRAR